MNAINVKQARAFLWNAAWLQEHMSAKWREEDESGLHDDRAQQFEHFQLAIIGAGGTGKTAVLQISEALTIYFAGPDTVRKLAPSNAAARLLGGDTLHSLCKLPFGNARLTTKKGRLNTDTLQRMRQKWKTAIAAYLDEVSMVATNQYLQMDVRMRQAKMKSAEKSGGIAMNLCGDLLQLPPVDKDSSRKSLAKP